MVGNPNPSTKSFNRKPKETARKPLNLLQKLYIREVRGCFQQHQRSGRLTLFPRLPRRLKFHINQLVPDSALRDFAHIFLGFLKDGQHVLSYTSTLEMDLPLCTLPHYVHRLYFWRFVPHQPLKMVSKIWLFRGYEIPTELYISVCQWPFDTSKILIHGYSPLDDREHRAPQNPCYLTIAATPPVHPCEECKATSSCSHSGDEHDDDWDSGMHSSFCLRHGFVLHVQYHLVPPFPEFDPKVSLKKDGLVVINTGDTLIALSVAIDNPADCDVATGGTRIKRHTGTESQSIASVVGSFDSLFVDEKSPPLPLQPPACGIGEVTSSDESSNGGGVGILWRSLPPFTSSSNTSSCPHHSWDGELATLSFCKPDDGVALHPYHQPKFCGGEHIVPPVTGVDVPAPTSSPPSVLASSGRGRNKPRLHSNTTNTTAKDSKEEQAGQQQQQPLDVLHESTKSGAHDISKDVAYGEWEYSESAGVGEDGGINVDCSDSCAACQLRPCKNSSITLRAKLGQSEDGWIVSSPTLKGGGGNGDCNYIESVKENVSPDFESSWSHQGNARTADGNNGTKRTSSDAANFTGSGVVASSTGLDIYAGTSPSQSTPNFITSASRIFVPHVDSDLLIGNEDEDLGNSAYQNSLSFEVYWPSATRLVSYPTNSVEEMSGPVVVVKQSVFDVEPYLHETAQRLCGEARHKYQAFTDYDIQILDVFAETGDVLALAVLLVQAEPKTKGLAKNQRNSCENPRKQYETGFKFLWNIETGKYQVVDTESLREMDIKKGTPKGTLHPWSPGRAKCALLQKKWLLPCAPMQDVLALTNARVFKNDPLKEFCSPMGDVAIIKED